MRYIETHIEDGRNEIKPTDTEQRGYKNNEEIDKIKTLLWISDHLKRFRSTFIFMLNAMI